MGTIGTPALGAGVEAYTRSFGYVELDTGTLAEPVAHSWQAPALSGARYVVVGPRSGLAGAIRLVESPAAPHCPPLCTPGWAALEICVPDVDAAVTGLTGAFRVLYGPYGLGFAADPALRAAQVAGPGGEVLYLTEIRRQPEAFSLPQSSGRVDGVFVAVLAATDLERTRSWFEDRFAVARVTDRRAVIPAVNEAQGQAPGATTRLSSLQLAGRNVLEVDQYPAQYPERSRPVAPGGLPCGVGVVTFGIDPATPGALWTEVGPDGLLIEMADTLTGTSTHS